MISQENTDGRFSKKSTTSYNRDSESTLTATFEITNSKGENRNICIPTFRSKKSILVYKKKMNMSVVFLFQFSLSVSIKVSTQNYVLKPKRNSTKTSKTKYV